jgi:3-oxoacyl-[acyl-carrier protein] reductase
MKKLKNKVALITGGARGLGRGYALRLAKLGAHTAIIDRNLQGFDVYEFEREGMTASTVMEECQKLGVQSIGLTANMSERDTAQNAIDQIVDELARLDIVICNAGGGTIKFADELGPGSTDLNTTATPSNCPQDTLTRVIDNNLMSCVYTCTAAVP